MKYTSKYFLRKLQEVNNLTESFGFESPYKWWPPEDITTTKDKCLELEGALRILTALYRKRGN